MTGPFTTPIVRVNENLDREQKARAAALLVAAEARPGAESVDLLFLADYVIRGLVLLTEDAPQNPYELFTENQMDLDPVHRGPFRPSRLANFGDPNPEAGLRGELVEDGDDIG